MRQFYYEIQIDGKPILLPDADITAEYTDLDSEESGRDESGVMHRIVARRGVLKMVIPYGNLDREEYLYMESLFAGKSDFALTYRNHDGSIATKRCYRSNHGIVIRNARTGLYRDYKCSIIEC